MIRERIAVAFITLSIAFSGVFGFEVVRQLNNPNSQLVASNASPGADATTVTDTASPIPGAATGGPSSVPGGGGGGTSTTTTTTGGGTTTTRGSAPKPATDQAHSGVTGDRILVGGIFDETNAVDSTVERDTVRAYFSKVNAAGGINGRKLVLEDCDSQYDNNVAHSCSQKMISDNVLAIVGWTAPKGEDNEVQYLTQNGVPVVGGLGTPHEFSSPLSYPVSVPFTRYGAGIADLFVKNGYKHPAIIYISDVGWVAPVRDSLLASLHARGIQETHVEAATTTDQSYSQHIAAMEHQNDTNVACASPTVCPDSVIAALDPYSYVKLTQAMETVNWYPPIVAGGFDKGSFQASYDQELKGAQSLVPFLSPYDNASNPTVSDYLSTVKKYYPSQYDALDVYTQHSWTSAMIFVEALKRAGRNVTRSTLVDALNTIQNFDTGWSKPISYGSGNHDPNHCFRFMKHDNQTAPQGSWHTVSDWNCYS
ncbi:MAG TPA: ABC transporter substrate-binding protein [Candidatus Dormibacteraeota bacterium]|jgi:ABC-type branched-subunit amino acid transport system substrate-binding protein|nr:ABC transporter substrate-binding protein [Candidatus Dormibacteraeota bacterium]